MIERLKKLNASNLDTLLQLEEAISLWVYATALREGYDLQNIEAPEWLTQSIDLLDEEIKSRDLAATLAEIRQTETALEGLKSTSERKTDLQKKLASLQRRASGAAVGGKG